MQAISEDPREKSNRSAAKEKFIRYGFSDPQTVQESHTAPVPLKACAVTAAFAQACVVWGVEFASLTSHKLSLQRKSY